jgi:hypothetical protein
VDAQHERLFQLYNEVAAAPLARSSHRDIVDRSAELTGLVDGPWERARSVLLYVRTRDEDRQVRIGEVMASMELARGAREADFGLWFRSVSCRLSFFR